MQDMFREIPYLDVLVNNAGISYIGLLTDMTYEECSRCCVRIWIVVFLPAEMHCLV